MFFVTTLVNIFGVIPTQLQFTKYKDKTSTAFLLLFKICETIFSDTTQIYCFLNLIQQSSTTAKTEIFHNYKQHLNLRSSSISDTINK